MRRNTDERFFIVSIIIVVVLLSFATVWATYAGMMDYSEYESEVDETDAVMIARTVFMEAGGLPEEEQAMVVWTILNRLDDGRFGDDIASVITAPYQFAYYSGGSYTDLQLDIAYDVLERWYAEHHGQEDVGRVLPKGYLYFYGDGVHNWFYKGDGDNSADWNFGLENPYETSDEE